MNRIFNILKILIQTKYQFKKPKNNKIIIFDFKGSTDIFSTFFLPNSHDTLYVRGEKINILIIILLIFKLKLPNLKNYIFEYLNCVKPEFIFHNSFNRRFFEINKKFLNFETTKIFIQSEKKNHLAYNEFNENNKKYNCDYLFVVNEAMKRLMNKNIAGKYIINGFFHNNDGPKINLSNLKEKVVFISQYRTFKKKNKNHNRQTIEDQFWKMKFSYDQFYQSDLLIAKQLKDYCDKENIDFEIVGASSKDKEGEKFFFSKVLGKNWKYVERHNNLKGYHLTQDAKFIATIDSTLGYECFSRGQRVSFFSIRSNYLKHNYSIFGWPLNLPKEGLCWTTTNNLSNFKRLTNFLINGTNEEWDKLRNETLKDLFHYDFQHTNYKEFIKSKNII